MSERRYYSSVSPKGQITLPAEVRRLLGIKPRDQVSISLEGGAVKVSPVRSRLLEHFQRAGALAHPLEWRQVVETAAEDHAEEVAKEGLA